MKNLPHSRRQFLFLAAAASSTAAAGTARLFAAEKSASCEEDVNFLLDELEKKAGHFFKAKGIDWKQVESEFRAEAKKVKDEVDHVRLCGRLVARLRDGHASLRDVKVKMPDESRGRRFTGPRVHLLAIGEKIYVRQAFKDAQAAGIGIGQEVVKIDGQPARDWIGASVKKLSDTTGYGTDAAALYAACHWGLADWEGTPIEFEVRDDHRSRKIRLVRNGGPNFAPIGPVFYPEGLQALGRQAYGKTKDGMAYVHLRDVPGDLPAQLDKMLEPLADAPGLILDCRANGGGGCDHDAVFGRFLPVGIKWRQYTGAGDKTFTGPMVVIVDPGVRSAGETLSGQFKEDGRAWMIGEGPTAGSSSSKTTISVPSGLFSVYFSVHSNKGRFNGGQGIEGIGVPPNEITPYIPADLLAGVDTQIRIATERLKVGLPADKVPWQKQRQKG